MRPGEEICSTCPRFCPQESRDPLLEFACGARSFGTPGEWPQGPTPGPGGPCLSPGPRRGLRPGSGAAGEGRARGPLPSPRAPRVPARVWGDFRTRTAPWRPPEGTEWSSGNPQGCGPLPSESGSPGQQVQAREPKVPRCPPAGWRCAPSAEGSAAAGGAGRQRPDSRLFLSLPPHLLFSSLLIVLRLEGHGSAGRQVGAAAAPRVQLQLRGVAAGLQRARLSAAARAAPAGARDAAGEPGQGLQVAAAAGPARGAAEPGGLSCGETWMPRHPAGTRGLYRRTDSGSHIRKAVLPGRTVAPSFSARIDSSLPNVSLGRACSGGPLSLFPLWRTRGGRLGG